MNESTKNNFIAFILCELKLKKQYNLSVKIHGDEKKEVLTICVVSVILVCTKYAYVVK